MGALLALLALAGCSDPPFASDAAPWHGPAEAPAEIEIVRTSYYVAMRDGTRLAVDVYLPAGLAPGERIPALIHQTRYWRGADFRWPVGLVADRPQGRAAFFPRHGWALVSADVRGTGASFGTRPYPYGREEIRDGADLAAWVTEQPWSSGELATDGVSYSGTAAELLTSRAPAGLAAAAPRYSLFDAYADISYPGGVPFDAFADLWPAANRALDSNRLPAEMAPLLPRLIIRGVRPVDPALMAEVVREHESNGDVAALSRSGFHRDGLFPDGNTAAGISPIGHADALRKAGVPLYSWSGWFDGAYSRSAIRRHVSLAIPGSRLILGPWAHGGNLGGSPTSAGESSFDANRELLRFFEHHVRGRSTGIETQPPVLYYTMVEDRWKGAASWPPPSETQAWHLQPEGGLARERADTGPGTDTYAVDFDTRTGRTARWDSLIGPDFHYGDRAAEDRKLLVYTSAPLEGALEVTGHPVVELFVASTQNDGAFFAYLEDVAPDGSVTYVTEGMLRARHRAVSSDRKFGIPGVPARSYTQADDRPLAPGRVAELRFDLLPVSYLFREGHAIRIAFAGADADHFARIPAEGDPTWTVYRDAANPSRVLLPVPSAPALPVH